MRTYKPSVSWLLKINSCQWKSAYCWLDSSHLKNFSKHIFEVEVNRKFDFSLNWKFCCDLSNVISGGNWLFLNWNFFCLEELWLSSRLKQNMLKKTCTPNFFTIKTVFCLVKQNFNNFLWQLFPETYMKICTVDTSIFISV